MSVDIEQVGPCTWQVTAAPDSGRAFWRVTVYENHKRKNMNPMAPVIAATRRAWRIDQAFSLEQISRREMARRRKIARGARTPQEFMKAMNGIEATPAATPTATPTTNQP